MKPIHFLCALLFLLAQTGTTSAQDMDAAMSKLTEDIAARIQTNGNKKLTVLDFTDLQGETSELGRYLAEQVTVNFVFTNRTFSVLDRANLKKILAEHKLTTTGLVDPENAKKLGMFAGVDAMVFGNVVLVGTEVNVVVKIIATETAEVVGGAKARFKADDNLKKLLSQPPKPEEPKPAIAVPTTAPAAAEPPKPPQTPASKPFGDLQASIESFLYNPGDSFYGYVTFTLLLTNSSATDSYGVALKQDRNKINLTNSRGEEFEVYELDGVDFAFEAFDGLRGKFTDVLPSSSVSVTGKGRVRWNGKPGDYRPYRLQSETYFAVESSGRYPNKRKFNLILTAK
jgi:TolB-like protein